MNNEKLKRIALISEIIGGIAILVTLVILVVQINENTNAIRLQTLGDARARLDETSLYKMNNSDLIAKSFSEPENLTTEELIKLAYLFVLHEGVLLTYYDAYTSGAISETDWSRWVNSAPGMFGDPVGRAIWEASIPQFEGRNRQNFAAEIDEAMQSNPTAGDHSWIRDIQELMNEEFR